MYKLQIGCLILMAFISAMFGLMKKKKSKMHNLFGTILAVGMVQIVFDIITVYTVNHLETVSPVLNRIVHQLYMGLLMLYICLVYVYCVALVEEKKKSRLGVSKLAIAALVVSCIGIIALPLEYIENPITNYSYGPVAFVAYGSVAVYIILAMWIVIKYWKIIEYKQKIAILIAMISEILVLFYQAAVPTALISCLAVAIVGVGLFLSVESPDSILIEKLDEEKKRADVANNAKTAFVANMSHEIRTPINSVLGMNEMIMRESKEENIRQYASDIQASAQALLGIINDILDIAKIETGKMEIIPVSYELRDFLYNVVNMMSLKAQNKDLELEVQVDEALPNLLEGDDIRIRQILVNLLNNAVKYTHEGKVTLLVKKESWEKNTAKIRFVVKDTGIGIKEEDMKKLFVAFERIEEKRNRNIEGTGLGINICVQLLEMMHSSLQVESEYGKGSTFSFVLEQKVTGDETVGEFDIQKKRALELSQYKAVFTAPNAKVLVVDDNGMNRKVFSNLLKQTKIQVEEADNGEACLQLVKQTHYDLIFMDHMMPGMDGIETFHTMQTMPDNLCKDTPVVILTANAVIGAKEHYLQEGFDAFLSKPVEPDKLERMIYEMLPKNLLIEGEAVACAEDETKTIEFPIIDGVDYAYGRVHFQNDTDYLESFQLFYNVLKSEADKLEQFFGEIGSEEGLNSYRIQVHSMKNSAAIVGIISLSGMAKVLEDAARNQELSTLLAMTPIFLTEWRKYREKLQILFEKEEKERKQCDKATLKAMLDNLKEATEEFDITRMDTIMAEMNEYQYAPELLDAMEKLTALVSQFDVDGTAELINQMEAML